MVCVFSSLGGEAVFSVAASEFPDFTNRGESLVLVAIRKSSEAVYARSCATAEKRSKTISKKTTIWRTMSPSITRSRFVVWVAIVKHVSGVDFASSSLISGMDA